MKQLTNELLYEKVKFLSSCFDGIHEDELIFLAEKIKDARNGPAPSVQPINEAVIWSFKSDKKDPDFTVIHENTDIDTIGGKTSTYSFSYVLPLNAVKEFSFHYPESSFRILKYIDDNEKQ